MNPVTKYFIPVFISIIALSGCSERKLKGGANYVLELDARIFLKRLSDFSNDSLFENSLHRVTASGKTGVAFLNSFCDNMLENNPAIKLTSLFKNTKPDIFNSTLNNTEARKRLIEQYTVATERARDIVARRLNRFGTPELSISADENKIFVSIPGQYKWKRIERIITSEGFLGFYETYDRKEILPFLYAANKILDQKLFARPDPKDSLLASTTKPKSRLLQMCSTHEHHTDVICYNIPNSCIGYVYARDSANLSACLRSKKVKNVWPADLHFVYGEKEFRGDSTNLLPVYMIKATNLYKPAMTGQHIASARAQENSENSSRSEVFFDLDKSAALTWKNITYVNKGKILAIIFDGIVVSAPMVEEEIPNGVSVINGNFTMEEAKDLGMFLENGSLPAPLKVIQKETIPSKD